MIIDHALYKESEFEAGSAELLRSVQVRNIVAFTSAVTILEMVLDMSSSGFAAQAEAATSLLEDIHQLSIVPLDRDMSQMAARHVLKDNITVHDAYHLATALHSEVQYFVN